MVQFVSVKGGFAMENNRTIRAGDIFRHFKNKLYQIVTVAYHSETGERYVVYQALYGDFRCYVRPYDMFMSEVDHNKYPDVKEQFRFTKVDSVNEEPETVAVSEETSSDEGVNPYLLKFLDLDTSAEKAEFLSKNRSSIDERLISDIAVSLDISADEGDLSERIDAVIGCLNTMSKYECGRLR